MVTWIRENSPAKLEGLWKSVLPEGSTAPPAEYAADLFWLLHQGHILLYTDDTLVVQEAREASTAEAGGEVKKAKKKKKNKKPIPAGEAQATPTVAPDAAETTVTEDLPTGTTTDGLTSEAALEPSSNSAGPAVEKSMTAEPAAAASPEQPPEPKPQNEEQAPTPD